MHMLLVECIKGSGPFVPVAIIGPGEWQAYKDWRVQDFFVHESTPEILVIEVRGEQYHYRWRNMETDPHK